MLHLYANIFDAGILLKGQLQLFLLQGMELVSSACMWNW